MVHGRSFFELIFYRPARSYPKQRGGINCRADLPLPAIITAAPVIGTGGSYRDDTMRSDISFPGFGGTTLRGWLYTPGRGC
jgi:hypothetical protein